MLSEEPQFRLVPLLRLSVAARKNDTSLAISDRGVARGVHVTPSLALHAGG